MPSSCFFKHSHWVRASTLAMTTSLVPSLNLFTRSFPSQLSPASSFIKSNPKTVHFPSKSKTLDLNRPLNPHHRRFIPLGINVTAGNSGDPSKKLEIGGVLDRARELFDSLPQPVKTFPWAKTLENFSRIILDLALAVVKYLSIPILALTQLSEMSYCAHERKMALIPIPFLVGFAVAGVLKDTAVEVYPDIKEGGFPWHLLLITMFFALLKLPGPYYPYWARLVIPHFANGGLWRSVWLILSQYKRTRSLSLGDNNQ